MELQFRIKNGDIRLGSICGELIEIGGERCIFGTMRDITDERRAANQLAAEKERLAVTLRSIGDAVITTDREGRIVLMNPIAEDLTGWREAEAAERPLLDVFRIVNERTREPCVDPVEKVLATGQIIGLANHTMLIARDGREFIIADSGASIMDLEGAIIGVVLVFRDITGQERIEKELLKMEKLQSLGVLAGGIAHDFNNFLTGIIGNLSLAKLDIQPGHPVLRPLDEMEKAALRAKELTQQLLTFSKGGEPVRRTAIVTDLVREAAQFALRGSNVRCDIKIDAHLRPADIDEGQIAQVIHNLILNADQAMPDGGIVTIAGTCVPLSPAATPTIR
jgi:PAS domain S-box-containing protein